MNFLKWYSIVVMCLLVLFCFVSWVNDIDALENFWATAFYAPVAVFLIKLAIKK